MSIYIYIYIVYVYIYTYTVSLVFAALILCVVVFVEKSAQKVLWQGGGRLYDLCHFLSMSVLFCPLFS